MKLKQTMPLLALNLGLAMGLASTVTHAETTGDWGIRALNIQASLDNDAPLYESTWVGTHNSYSNADDDNFMGSVLNQSTSVKNQLYRGVRELVFDVHYRNDKVRVCHDNTSLGVCIDGITGNRQLVNAMDDVIEWLNDGNRDQVVIIKLELAKTARNNINKVHKKLDNYLSEYYLPSAMSFHGNQGSDGCTALPTSLTKSKVLASGKNIVLLNTESCRSNNSFNDYVFYGGSGVVDYNNTGDVSNAANTIMTRVKDGATKDSNSSVKLQPNSVQGFFDAGLNIFETYGYDAGGSAWKKDGEYPLAPENMVWSWDNSGYEPNGTDSCAKIYKGTNKFRDAYCSSVYYAACRKLVWSNGNRVYGGQWIITSSPTTFANADTQCEVDGGGEYFFATPRNKAELNAVINARNSAVGSLDLWINYQKSGGKWQADIGEADTDMQSYCSGNSGSICGHLNNYLKLLDGSSI